jgi:hypothetical protein
VTTRPVAPSRRRRTARTLGDILQHLATLHPQFVKAVRIAAEADLKRITRRLARRRRP